MWYKTSTKIPLVKITLAANTRENEKGKEKGIEV